MGCCDTEEKRENEELGVRGCTDVFWLCLYIVFWILMVLNLKLFVNKEMRSFVLIIVGINCGLFFRLWKSS